MKRLRISRRAAKDLDGIQDFTARTWGAAQALQYDDTLQAAIKGLRDGSTLSQPADDLRQGYRRARVGSHFVFFLETRDAVEVVRVLHQRMDAGRWV